MGELVRARYWDSSEYITLGFQSALLVVASFKGEKIYSDDFCTQDGVQDEEGKKCIADITHMMVQMESTILDGETENSPLSVTFRRCSELLLIMWRSIYATLEEEWKLSVRERPSFIENEDDQNVEWHFPTAFLDSVRFVMRVRRKYCIT